MFTKTFSEAVRVRRTRTTILSLIATIVVLVGVSASPVVALTPMSKSEMSSVSGRAGLSADFQFGSDLTVDRIDYQDGDGLGSGNAGHFRLENVAVGGSGSPEFEGFQLDVEGSNQVVMTPPNGPNIDLTASSVYLGDPSSHDIGEFSVSGLEADPGFNADETDFVFGGTGDGLSVTPRVLYEINEIQWQDNNGNATGNAGTFGAGSVRIGNLFGNNAVGAANLGSWDVDVDPNDGLVLEPGADNTLDLRLDPRVNSNRIGRVAVQDVNLAQGSNGNTRLELRAKNEGLIASPDLLFELGEVRFEDPDDGGRVGVEDLLVGNLGTNFPTSVSTNQADLGDIPVDIDGRTTHGLVVGVPNTDLDVRLGNVHINGNDVGEVALRDVNLDGGNGINYTFEGMGDGLGWNGDAGGLYFEAREIRYTDPDDGGYVGLGQRNQGVQFHNTSGGAINWFGCAGFCPSVNADANEGLLVNLGWTSSAFSLDVADIVLGDASDGSTNGSLGSFHLTGMDLENEIQIGFKGTGDGLRIEPIVDGFPVDRVQWTDDSGWTGGAGDRGDVRLVNSQLWIAASSSINNPAQIDMNVGTAGGDGLRFDVQDLHAQFESSALHLDNNAVSFTVNNANLDGTSLMFHGHDDGLTADLNPSADVHSVVLEGDGGSCSNCSGNAGRLQFGSGSSGGITVENADLNGMTLNVDATNGIVATMPSGSLDVSVNETRIGTNSSTDAGVGMGARNLSLDGTTVRVGAN